MSLSPLATLADLDARGITYEGEGALAVTFLEVASAAVRDAAGCPIGVQTSTVRLYGDGTRLVLPGSPIVSVASVVLDGETITDWKLRPGGLFRACGWADSDRDSPAPADVTYTYGLGAVPADIVDMVCRMAAAALVAATSEDDGSGLAVNNITQERLGQYAVTYNAESGATEMELSERTRNRLAARFGGGAAMVGSW